MAEQDRIAAIETATRAVDVSQGSTNLSTVRAMLDLSELGKTGYSKSALTILEKLPPSRTKAELLMRLALDNIPLLEEAIAISETIGAKRTQSFALEQLGQVYESSGRYRQALDATESGLWIAGQIGANDSLYRLQWLRARIRAQTGQKEKAIAAYRSAISTLQNCVLRLPVLRPTFNWMQKRKLNPSTENYYLYC
ncbi:MAG: hypothetical protein HC790_13440 [Acaryochloridaceae cyanobacterium CSU_3_4]|nr:hypothetical protein [Acaryochloridaceae cyanobacterium CSU_3_4]